MWAHHTIREVKDEGSAIGIMFENLCWCWIPRPTIEVRVGERISVREAYPGGYHIRVALGEVEVPTFYALHQIARLRA